MSFKKSDFLEEIKKRVYDKPVEVVHQTKKLIGDRADLSKSRRKTKKMQNELVGKMMSGYTPKGDKGYPSGTLIGDRKFERRKKEVKKMVGEGKMKQARDFIQEKREKFNKDNY